MTRWLPRPAAPDARLRLFCLPHAGVGASAYAGWVAPLGRVGVDVCPVQLPGRENRAGEPPARAVGPLVDALVPALLDRVDRPFALFGHSMGALVAFELARALGDRAAPLVHLFVSGRIAPQLADPRPALHDQPDDELCARLAGLGGMPPELLADRELIAFLLPLLRADLALNETYRYPPGPPLAVPVTAFGGDRDPKVTEVELRAWAHQTSARFAACVLPGGHFFVRDSAGAVLGRVAADLSAAPATAAPGRAGRREAGRAGR